ncbi:hypothetical protein N0V88_003270 [Collariella sp. IMI 366227]|nr:hypothetical protein N0V88_003270 [Collariella sp. IMI 366227]
MDVWSLGVLMRGFNLGQEYSSFMHKGSHGGRTVVDFWGGPFFDDDGLSLESSLTTISGEEKSPFPDFLRRTLTWYPAERATTEELMRPHPWLGSVMQELLDKLEERNKVTPAMQESVRALEKDL